MIRRVKLTHLERAQVPVDRGPGLSALEFHHPFDEKGKRADLDMRFNAARQPVIHRLHLDSGSFQGSESSLDDEHSFISRCGVFGSDFVVVDLDHPLEMTVVRPRHYPSYALIKWVILHHAFGGSCESL